MLVRLRQKPNSPATAFFVWQPVHSRNGNWYTIHRDGIRGVFPNGDDQLTRQLFNCLFQNLDCIVEARYLRKQKILELTL